MAPPEISVIIVNYGTAGLAIDAVQSVRGRSHGGRSVDIHLVDNASPGNDAPALSRAHADLGWGDGVTLHLEDVNHGFGRANNLVMSRLAQKPHPPDKVFLLNPDARLESEALAILADFLDQRPEAACAGPSIAGSDGKPASAAFRFPSLASEFSDSLAFGPVAGCFRNYTVPLAPVLATQRVAWVSGAAVMLRWSALSGVKGFDPDFFLYFEEVDLMKRLGRQGWETWHVAEARVSHIEGAATTAGDEPAVRQRPDYWYDSWLTYHLKNHGRLATCLSASARLIGWSANRAISAARRRPPAAPPGYVGGLSRRVLRPLVGLPARDPS